MQSKSIPNVVLTGFQKGKILKELYSHAGLFILPSYHEGLPIVLLEALSYGLSCLASGIPANRELDLEEERYFTPGDIDLLSYKLLEFSDKPNTEFQRQRRIQQIEELYNWNLIAQKSLAVYDSCLPTTSRYKLAAETTTHTLVEAMPS